MLRANSDSFIKNKYLFNSLYLIGFLSLTNFTYVFFSLKSNVPKCLQINFKGYRYILKFIFKLKHSSEKFTNHKYAAGIFFFFYKDSTPMRLTS